MKGARPKAEELVHAELQRRGLHKTMEPLDSVILLDSGKVVLRESLFTGVLNRLRTSSGLPHQITVPDFLWLQEKNPKLKPTIGLPAFLDGVVHKTDGNRRRDEWISNRLTQLHFHILRFPYNSPSNRWVQSVVDDVEVFIR